MVIDGDATKLTPSHSFDNHSNEEHLKVWSKDKDSTFKALFGVPLIHHGINIVRAGKEIRACYA